MSCIRKIMSSLLPAARQQARTLTTWASLVRVKRNSQCCFITCSPEPKSDGDRSVVSPRPPSFSFCLAAAWAVNHQGFAPARVSMFSTMR